MYKLNTKQLPLPFDDMFVRNDSIHSYLTRQASSFYLPLNTPVYNCISAHAQTWAPF